MRYTPRHARPRSRRALLDTATTAVATVIAVGATSSTAFALWTTTGAGTTSATADRARDLTASPVTVGTNLLYPGATVDAKVTISNPNPWAVTVSTITGGTVASDKGTGCDASTGVTFVDQRGSFTVPASSSVTFALPGAVSMSNASDSSCQGAVFTIPVTLSGTSS